MSPPCPPTSPQTAARSQGEECPAHPADPDHRGKGLAEQAPGQRAHPAAVGQGPGEARVRRSGLGVGRCCLHRYRAGLPAAPKRPVGDCAERLPCFLGCRSSTPQRFPASITLITAPGAPSGQETSHLSPAPPNQLQLLSPLRQSWAHLASSAPKLTSPRSFPRPCPRKASPVVYPVSLPPLWTLPAV